jgi:hypothetical protein
MIAAPSSATLACPMTCPTRLALDLIARRGPAVVFRQLLENVPRTAEQEGPHVALREARPEKGEGAWRVLLVKGTGTAGGAILP